jgi:hypothetical protein
MFYLLESQGKHYGGFSVLLKNSCQVCVPFEKNVQVSHHKINNKSRPITIVLFFLRQVPDSSVFYTFLYTQYTKLFSYSEILRRILVSYIFLSADDTIFKILYFLSLLQFLRLCYVWMKATEQAGKPGGYKEMSSILADQ